ncbi:FAD-binding protein [Alkaliphilus crotonatoxidans]
MKQHRHEVIIVGLGLGALATAARLYELGKRNIGIYASAYGGTPYIAAINFVLENNPYGDTPEQYINDMLRAGYEINDRELVSSMCHATRAGYELLKRWDVEFSTLEDGSPRLRHASGSTYPRSLCNTDTLIGNEILQKLKDGLTEKGIHIYLGSECVKLLSENNQVYGITVKDKEGVYNAYGSTVVAAWGGVGNLFGISTYPKDIKGNTIAIAREAGAALVDMEFLEYEPMVVLSPPGALGEPCPTAMLGEGAHLLNTQMERFMLKVRPQGEAGAPKTLINHEIWKQVKAGKGTKNQGVYADLRHIPIETLKAYPWFYNRLVEAGIDPATELLEVGPMAHSYSGGIKVNSDYESTVKGLYAVGEAAGSIHGACRLAGNAAAQATLSGLLCAEAIAKKQIAIPDEEFPVDYLEDQGVYQQIVPQVKQLALNVLGIYRNGHDLATAQEKLEEILSRPEIKKDTETYQITQSVLIMVRAALERKESRGTHMRTDYPETDQTYQKSIII